jgi:hypothetical protein
LILVYKAQPHHQFRREAQLGSVFPAFIAHPADRPKRGLAGTWRCCRSFLIGGALLGGCGLRSPSSDASSNSKNASDPHGGDRSGHRLLLLVARVRREVGWSGGRKRIDSIGLDNPRLRFTNEFSFDLGSVSPSTATTISNRRRRRCGP